MSSYLIPANPIIIEYEIKKSRFIAKVAPIADRVEAMQLLDQAKREYSDARHHCWAYVLGNQVSAAMSDDGEPSGTAGKPILNVLQHKHVGDIMLIVIRYFGGIKLGAGGLVRAYSTAAQMAMDVLPLREQVNLLQVDVCCEFSKEQLFRHWAGGHKAIVLDVQYSQKVTLRLAMPEHQIANLTAFCESNAASWRTLDEGLLHLVDKG
jgi:uncharacterized YigZ family protein